MKIETLKGYIEAMEEGMKHGFTYKTEDRIIAARSEGFKASDVFMIAWKLDGNDNRVIMEKHLEKLTGLNGGQLWAILKDKKEFVRSFEYRKAGQYLSGYELTDKGYDLLKQYENMI